MTHNMCRIIIGAGSEWACEGHCQLASETAAKPDAFEVSLM